MFGYEVAVASFLNDSRFIPVQELGIEKSRHVDSIAQFYSNRKGALGGIPFNISTGVMVFNKAAFAKAGLNPDDPPATWPEMEEALEKFFSEGWVSILLQGGNRYALIKRGADFEIGAAPLPYWPQFAKEPHTLNTGGATLWAFKGRESDGEVVKELLVAKARPIAWASVCVITCLCARI